jgi:2-keto-3-deoxy-L-fuconate dehydrogenase
VKRALVTGAGSGIGAAVANRLAADGMQVVRADLRELGGDALQLDVRDEAQVAPAMRDLDVLVNVAGIGSTTNAPETPLEVWEDVFAVNARGTFLCCKHAIPGMAARGAGAIVNIASVAALIGLRNRAAYCASKGAVVALTRALAVDHVADGIRVNAVCPGTVDSPWVRRLVEEAGESLDELRARQPLGRLGTPDEIADAVAYLASAEFVTGTVLTIDGGLTAACCRASSSSPASPTRPAWPMCPTSTPRRTRCCCASSRSASAAPTARSRTGSSAPRPSARRCW